MKWLWWAGWLVPVVLALVFWWWPPQGDDAYYHSVSAVEQVRAWQEGAAFPGYHRAWNGGTGSFAPTIYSPIPLAIQGGLAWLVGDGQRAVGLSLSCAILAAVALLVASTRRPEAVVLAATPYVLAVAVTRATTTEAWALAGAAAVLALGMPPGVVTRARGLGLAAGVILVAGSQVGMLLQLSWLLAAAWCVGAILIVRDRSGSGAWYLSRGLWTLSWAAAGLLTAAVFWLPAMMEGGNLALAEMVAGPLDWRRNFLPGNSDLGVFLTVTACCLGVLVVIVLLRGRGGERLPLAAAATAALLMTLWISTPAWHLPGMNFLQFPWRFVGPATVLGVMALGSLHGRWRWLAVALLVVPAAAVPLRLGTAAGGVPVAASPEELARVAHERWGLVPVLPSASGFYAPGFHRLASLQELGLQEARVLAEQRAARGGVWRVTAVTPTSVVLPLQWWPEWEIMVDGRAAPFANRSGLVTIGVPAGTSIVRATLGPSRSRALGGSASLAGVAALAVLAWAAGRRADTARMLRGVR